jgi:TPR repeat protein
MFRFRYSFNWSFFRAYKLFKQAAESGHIGAKEELAFGHLMGTYLPMDFRRARAYFEEGVAVGSPQSHYVNGSLVFDRNL